MWLEAWRVCEWDISEYWASRQANKPHGKALKAFLRVYGEKITMLFTKRLGGPFALTVAMQRLSMETS